MFHSLTTTAPATPSIDDLAEIMAAEFLVAIIQRCSYGIRLAPCRRHLEFDLDIPIPLGTFLAVLEHEAEIVDAMDSGFLGHWVDDGEGGLKARWASLVSLPLDRIAHWAGR